MGGWRGGEEGGKGERRRIRGGCKGETIDQRSLSCRGFLLGLTPLYTHTHAHTHKCKHSKTGPLLCKTVPTLRWKDIPLVRCVKAKTASLFFCYKLFSIRSQLWIFYQQTRVFAVDEGESKKTTRFLTEMSLHSYVDQAASFPPIQTLRISAVAP